MSDYDRTKDLITPQPTDIWGLSFFPNMEPHKNNDDDGPAFGGPHHTEVTECNMEVVRQTVAELGNDLHACMEIGVDRNSNVESMSKIILRNRPVGSFYLGVDIDDKSYLNNEETNTWTVQCNSHEQDRIRTFLKEKSIEKLDLLFIDGWHSVNTTINDWKYADLLSDNGVVIVHDTNRHPGDVALCQAVDKSLFTVTRYCTEDNGIAVFKRIKNG